ncbi:roquin-1-like isoform X2 [Glandiceps talaboti]
MPIQAPQWTEFLLCPICYNDFDESARRPISLGCGHTVCRTCLAQLHRKQCPFDQSTINTDINSLPANYALLQLVGAEIPKTDSVSNGVISQYMRQYEESKKCVEELALLLKPLSKGNNNAKECILSRPMQRKLVTLVNCQLVEDEGRARALRAARSLGERTVTELILQHQNPQQLSANLWAAVRARGCQFLGPAMQEECLKLVLLALEDGSALSRKVLVLFVVQKLEPQFPQASKTSVGHVVQLLYRASCFKVTKREEDSSLMQLKEEFCGYEALRREHDAQIVQIAMEAGLRISPEQWSSLLYGDASHKSHMQSIIDKLQTPASFAASVQELSIALQRSGDPANLARLRTDFELLADIESSSDSAVPTWEATEKAMNAAKTAVMGLVDFIQHHSHQRKILEQSQNNKYKTSMCRDVTQRGGCPRGANCTFAHSQDELEKFRQKSRRAHMKGKPPDKKSDNDDRCLSDDQESSSSGQLLARGSESPYIDTDRFEDDETKSLMSEVSSMTSVSISSRVDSNNGTTSPMIARNTPTPDRVFSPHGTNPLPPVRYDSREMYGEGYLREAGDATVYPHHQYPAGPGYRPPSQPYLPHESRTPSTPSQPYLPHESPYDHYYKQPYNQYPQYRSDEAYMRGVPSPRYPDEAYTRNYIRSTSQGYPDEGYRGGAMMPGTMGYARDPKAYPESYTGHRDRYYMDTNESPELSYHSKITHRQDHSINELQDIRKVLVSQLDSLPVSSHSMAVQQSRSTPAQPVTHSTFNAPMRSGATIVATNKMSRETSSSSGNHRASTHLMSHSSHRPVSSYTIDRDSHAKERDYFGERVKEEAYHQCRDSPEYNPWRTESGVTLATSLSAVNKTPPTSSTTTLSKTKVRHMSLEDDQRELPGFGDGERSFDSAPPRTDHNHQSLSDNAERGRKIRQEMERLAAEKLQAEEDELIPFEYQAPRVSKYGPISRMSRSIMHETGPLQAMPTQRIETTAVMSYSDSQVSARLQSTRHAEKASYGHEKQPKRTTDSNVHEDEKARHSKPLERVHSASDRAGVPPQSTAEREQLKIELRQVDQQIRQQQVRKARDTLILHREETAISAHTDPDRETPYLDDGLLARKLQEVELDIQMKTLVPHKDTDTQNDIAIARQLQQDEIEYRKHGAPKPQPPVVPVTSRPIPPEMAAIDYQNALAAKEMEQITVAGKDQWKQQQQQQQQHIVPAKQEVNDRHYAEQLVYKEAQAMGIPVTPSGYTAYPPHPSVVQPGPMMRNPYPGNVRPVIPAAPSPGAYYYPPRVGGYAPPVVPPKEYVRPSALPSNVVEDHRSSVYPAGSILSETVTDGNAGPPP